MPVRPLDPPTHAFLPAFPVHPDRVPWVPTGTPGKAFRPLQFLPDDRGFVELLRMEPGVAMPLHRHTGEVHVYHLGGSRELCTGERIGPGEYLHEPAGNTDGWRVVGSEPLLALVVVMGAVEFLGDGGQVLSRATAGSLRADYERHCRAHGFPMLDLMAR